MSNMSNVNLALRKDWCFGDIRIIDLHQLRNAVHEVAVIKKEIKAMKASRPFASIKSNAIIKGMWDEVHEWERAIVAFAEEVEAIRFPEEYRRLHGGR